MMVTILERGINDILQAEIILAMTHIKNCKPTQALKGNINTAEIQNQALPNI